MATGTVKWFNSDKGYGFIAPMTARRCFRTLLRYPGFRHRNLEEDQKVDIEQGQKGPRRRTFAASKTFTLTAGIPHNINRYCVGPAVLYPDNMYWAGT